MMRKWLVMTALVAALVATAGTVTSGLAPGGSQAVFKSAGPSPFEAIVQPHVDSKQFMGAALVARDTFTMMNKGFGMATVEPAAPNTPATRFPIGSITKQFTAASILLLEDRGRLAIIDPVSKYVPDAPKAWAGITIFHLLTHTSGLASDTSRPLESVPGETFSYSNAGYQLLGRIIETVSGQTYGAFVAANIFMPLKMESSGYWSASTPVPGRAAGSVSTGGPVAAVDVDPIQAFSAGALYSTTDDLLKWQRGLFGGTLLSPASLQKMTTPFKNDYALGIEIRTRNGMRVIEHSGGIGAFRSMLAYYPDNKVTVAVLGNMGSLAGDIADALGAAGNGMMKRPAPTTAAPAAVTVAPETLAKYAGSYPMRDAVMVITVEDGRLMSQVGTQPKAVLTAESETRFSSKEADQRIEFFSDASGTVTSLVLRQGGMMMKAPKK
jgi:CubicO group peptidase (beta-lactamase class C family)